MRRFLAFGVSAAVSAAFFPAIPVGAEATKPGQAVETPQPAVETPRPAVEMPVPAGSASRGSSNVTPASRAAPDEDEARRLRLEDERKATESKEKMKKRPGYKEDVPGPRA